MMDMEELKPRIVQLANETASILTGSFAEVQAIIDGSDMAFGVWQDAGFPDGVGVLLVKGLNHLRDLVASGSGDEMAKLKTSAIPCVSAEQAHALKEMVGEGRDH